jgi:HlyD family secretion protein
MDRKRLLLLTLGAVLAAAAIFAWRGGQQPRVAVTFADATRGPITREVLTSGTLEPAREVEVGAQVSGTVQSIHADFNQRVTAGQVIARLDPSAFDAEVAQARGRAIQADADVESKQVVLGDAETKAGRARELRAQDLITQAELDAAALAVRQAQADLTAAKAAAKSARALLAAAEVDRSHTIIRSPIDGIVVNRSVEAGQTLASRMEAPVLFRIADLRRMQMQTDVSEAEVGGVRQGSDVRFQIDSLGPREFHGTVAEVRLAPVLESGATGTTGAGTTSGGNARGNTTAATTGTQGATATTGTAPATSQAQPGSAAASSASSSSVSSTGTPPAGSVVSYTAIVDVDNSDHRIAPGTTAIVTLPTAQRSEVLRVPNNALSFRPSPAVLEAAGQPSTLGQRAPADRALDAAPDREVETDPGKGRVGYVWKFENGKFLPVEVRAGVADETWTELLSGPIQPGDRLVTAAAVAR